MKYDLIIYDSKTNEVVFRMGEEEDYIKKGYGLIESQGEKVKLQEKEGKLFIKNEEKKDGNNKN